MATRRKDRSRIWFPLLVSLGLFGIYASLQFEPGVHGVRRLQVEMYVLFAALIALIFAAVRVFDLIVFDLALSRGRKVVAPQLLREIVNIILYFVAFAFLTWKYLGADLRNWFFTGSALALILGFALQDTLGNLFAGISLHLEDSFEIGDVIRSGEHTGVVEGTRWRGTRIRTLNNNLVIIPNSVLARAPLEVYPHSYPNGRIVTVGIDYNVPPAKAIDVLTQAASHVDGVSREMPCFARVGSFGDSAVTYEIKYFMRDYAQRDRIDADIRKAIWYAMKRNNIPIPFPIRAQLPYEAPPPSDQHLTHDELLGRLRGVDILSPVHNEDIEMIAGAARFHVYSKGEAILARGAAGDSLFVLHEGNVSVRITDDTVAGRHEVAQLGPGAVFGEMALLTGEARTADVIALTDVVAIEIGKDALDPVLRDHPGLAEAITKKVMERRDMIDAIRMESREDVEKTIISKIKAYFGLGL